MSAHLLSLATLHAAAPGVMEVIFGPDGDFEGAPFWAGPVTETGRYSNRGANRWVSSIGRQVHTIEITPSLDLDDAALDLRIPSVAARLAGLCARAATTDLPFRVWDEAQDIYGRTMRGDWGSCGGPQQLAALTLTLAPKIAALKVSP